MPTRTGSTTVLGHWSRKCRMIGCAEFESRGSKSVKAIYKRKGEALCSDRRCCLDEANFLFRDHLLSDNGHVSPQLPDCKHIHHNSRNRIQTQTHCSFLNVQPIRTSSTIPLIEMGRWPLSPQIHYTWSRMLKIIEIYKRNIRRMNINQKGKDLSCLMKRWWLLNEGEKRRREKSE